MPWYERTLDRACSAQALGPHARRYGWVLLAFLLAFLLSFTTHVHANIAIPGSLTRTHYVDGHGTVEGSVVVINTSSEPQFVEVTLGDWEPGTGGGFLSPGSSPHSAARFISPEEEVFLIPPNERRTWRYKIDVPDAADVANASYWSMLFFEPVEDQTAREQQDDASEGFSIRTKTRFAVGVIVDVGRSEAPRIRFDNVDVGRDGDGSGDLSIGVDVLVDGPYVRSGSLRMQMIDQSSGEEVHASSPVPIRVYPSGPTARRFRVGDLPSGSYETLFVAEVGDDLYALRFDLDVGP